MFKKIICAIICCTLMLALGAGCHKNDQNVSKVINKTITIDYYNGMYGSKWIQAIADAYKTENPDVTIVLKADSKLDQNADSILESDVNVPDIMFLSNTDWEYWASKGYIENLTDLFGTTVDNGENLKQKIQPDYLTHCLLNGKYWIVPWEDGVAGLVYNVDMFKENNWTVPATMQEFYALLPQIKAAGIVPIAWSGSNLSDWSYAVNAWWAQEEGRDGVDTYLKMGSPEVYHQQGRLDALQEFSNLILDNTNSMDDAIEADQSKAFNLFFGSKAAMLLGGSWVESQIGDGLPNGFNMAIMRFPAIDNAIDANINVDASGGFAVIPSMSQNKQLAEDFLLFMSTDKMLKLYTSITSSPRPFIYDAASSSGLDDFGKSVMNIWQAGDNVYLFSSNPLYYGAFSDWPESGAPFMQILSGQTTPQKAFDDNYYYVVKNWNTQVSKN